MKRKFLLVAVSLIFVFAWSQESSAPELIESILSESEDSQSKISSPDEVVSEEDSQNNETEIPNVFLPENEIPEIKDEPKQETYDAISGSQPSENIKFKYTKEKIYPVDTRPKKHDSSKNYVDRSKDYEKKCNDILKYGLEGQITELIDELTKNQDNRFVDGIYDLFQETKSVAVKEKILDYFTKLKDSCLASYAVEIINDPYDEKNSIVEKCFKYVSEADIKDANPGLVDLVDKEEDAYFTGALSALGETGGKEEALFLADYLDRDDLNVSQRQALMRVLGRIKAVETWQKISEIAKDENENTFVRMYAAEAIGAMEKPESEDILVELFESNDPNLRTYVIKGISYFNDKKSSDLIIQALRDSQYKVRLEAVSAVGKNRIDKAVPFLIFRCKDKDEQKQVKEKCYSVIADLNTSDGNDYLISVLKDKKIGDATKAKVSAALLEYNHAGTKEVIELARSALKSDIQKNLRYALGKEFAKYDRSEFADICAEYIASDDVATQGTGLDIWAKGRYSSVKAAVEEIAKDAEEENLTEEKEKPKGYQFGVKKKNANAKKAKRILEQS
ncbi:MAG: HEAT repeat domain-containing protein [Treponema succinifaciens]|uniref:HEAT repeat domain-containing protein n=1 Tax=Treponema TaxID=157 RepID=UPI0023EFDD05|nr:MULTISPECIES: HEAT repeat domain-containing protein [Treponema]MDD6962770.1 HEAT repeat domain-containing protein [Treponema succinifaciens]MDY5116596.1 HEAT repeat domain-containing protein [Treponema succinifaciens]